MVMISTSRFFTCVSSCAITPSSSAGESVFMIPVVAHTVALFCERPIANAFGTVGVGHGDLRLRAGRPGCRAARSSRGARAPPRARPPWRPSPRAPACPRGRAAPSSRPPMTTTITTRRRPAESEHADEGHVQEAEQEQRQRASGPEGRYRGGRSRVCGGHEANCREQRDGRVVQARCRGRKTGVAADGLCYSPAVPSAEFPCTSRGNGGTDGPRGPGANRRSEHGVAAAAASPSANSVSAPRDDKR